MGSCGACGIASYSAATLLVNLGKDCLALEIYSDASGVVFGDGVESGVGTRCPGNPRRAFKRRKAPARSPSSSVSGRFGSSSASDAESWFGFLQGGVHGTILHVLKSSVSPAIGPPICAICRIGLGGGADGLEPAVEGEPFGIAEVFSPGSCAFLGSVFIVVKFLRFFELELVLAFAADGLVNRFGGVIPDRRLRSQHDLTPRHRQGFAHVGNRSGGECRS